ncbi:unnamed protein product [Effrenium voratum]|nr:unnamed protein product [Effrenium voratum]
MERRGALVLELLGSRGCLAPEDLCQLSVVNQEWRSFADAEAPWLVLARIVKLRPLPFCLESGGEVDPQASAKRQLLQSYEPVFHARRRIRRLWRRANGFWRCWAPEALASEASGGCSERQLAELEAKQNSELPEDLAEYLRCDGHEKEAFWFAEAQPGALAFRVGRLLGTKEMAQKALSPGWLPVACSREGTFTCIRLQHKSETASFGEVWSTPNDRDFDESHLRRQTTCFTEYLEDYVGLLESIPTQFAEQRLLSSLGQVLPELFACPRIYCNEQSSWITTGLGKGKGNLWQRVDRSHPVRIIFPSLGKSGKRSGSFARSWLLGK